MLTYVLNPPIYRHFEGHPGHAHDPQSVLLPPNGDAHTARRHPAQDGRLLHQVCIKPTERMVDLCIKLTLWSTASRIT
jgi:hypothetical protein